MIDAIYLYPLVGGIVAYLFGRSRRGAFISATLGVLLVDVFQFAWLINQGAPASYAMMIGGVGAFDAIVLAGIFAVILAELVGECLERISGGLQGRWSAAGTGKRSQKTRTQYPYRNWW
ncbi:MAG: DUF1614 domain-containing protein [Candidatus Syntrophopropionicum ammoniitolerans]